MEGLLFVDKPASWSSFDVVKYVRSIVARALSVPPKRVKVGHSGTLDPAATGLMLMLVGKNYTSRAQDFLKLDKSYEVTMMLGKESTTGDSEGYLRTISDDVPSQSTLTHALNKFHGEIFQTPPIYSAVQVNGVRAYKLARAGKVVNLPERKVFIHNIDYLNYEYPMVEFKADVSSGTYIRTLVEDIGKELGCGAYTTNLRRTRIGSYSIDSAVMPKEINEQTIIALLNQHTLLI